jgi:glycosyltransferase involved in cell wall biosynthesis
MLAKRPIIYGIDSGNLMVVDANCGIAIEPNNVDELIKAIEELKSKDKKQLDKLGANGYNYLKQNHQNAVNVKLLIKYL